MSTKYTSQISTGSSYISFIKANIPLFLMAGAGIAIGTYLYIKFKAKASASISKTKITNQTLDSSNLQKFVGCWKSNDTKAIIDLEINPNNKNQIVMNSPIINQIYTLKDDNTIVNDLGEEINYQGDSISFANYSFTQQ